MYNFLTKKGDKVLTKIDSSSIYEAEVLDIIEMNDPSSSSNKIFKFFKISKPFIQGGYFLTRNKNDFQVISK